MMASTLKETSFSITGDDDPRHMKLLVFSG